MKNKTILKLILSGPFYKSKPRTDCPLRSPGKDARTRREFLCLGRNSKCLSHIPKAQEAL